MTARRPLVIVSGTTTELPTGDTILGISGSIILSVVTRTSTVTTISASAGGTLPILNHNGSTTTNVTVA